MIRMVVLRACGQVSGGPTGVAAQSWQRISAPISPPPASKPGLLEEASAPMRLRGGIVWLLAIRRASLSVRNAARSGANHLTGVLVTSRSNLTPDEGIQFSG